MSAFTCDYKFNLGIKKQPYKLLEMAGRSSHSLHANLKVQQISFVLCSLQLAGKDEFEETFQVCNIKVASIKTV